MSKEAIVERLETLIRQYREGVSVTPDMPVLEQFEDSVELMDFVLTLEDEFNLDISDDEAERFVTLADVVDYIDSH